MNKPSWQINKRNKEGVVALIVCGLFFLAMIVFFAVTGVNDYRDSSATYADFEYKEYAFDHCKQNDLGDGDYQCYVYVKELETPLTINNLLSTRTVRERLNTLNKGDIISCYLELGSNNIVEMTKGEQFILSLEERNQIYRSNALLGFFMIPIFAGLAVTFFVYAGKEAQKKDEEIDGIEIKQKDGKTVLRKKSRRIYGIWFFGVCILDAVILIFFREFISFVVVLFFGGASVYCGAKFVSTLFDKIMIDTHTKEIRIYNPFLHKGHFDEIHRITTFYLKNNSEGGGDHSEVMIEFKGGKVIVWNTTDDEQSKQLEKKLKTLIYPDDHVFR